jgi:ubiquinone/menaquinone biosynthesis C-methylase UbiE
MRRIPLQDESCDFVFCIATLHHIPTAELELQALKELQRILTLGGRLVMTNWYLSAQPHYVLQQVRQRLSHPRLYAKTDFRDFFIPWKLRNGAVRYRYYRALTPRQVQRLLSQAGFSSIQTSIGYGERDWSGRKTKRNIVSSAIKGS